MKKMEGKGSNGKRVVTDKSEQRLLTGKNDTGFIDIVFQWSLEDIFNNSLYKNQVEHIPVSFQSVEQYFGSYLLPLLEETRAELRSSMEVIARAPYAEVTSLDVAISHETLLFDVKVDYWRTSSSGCEPYKTLPGDVLFIADAKPETASDLQRLGRTWRFVLVTEAQTDDNEDNSSSPSFRAKTLDNIASKDEMQQKPLFVIHLMNVTANIRIWNALHMKRNLNIIKEVLHTDSMVVESCSHSSLEIGEDRDEIYLSSFLSKLNESQKNSVVACLNKMKCKDKSHVELIWGPPGTGKTKTVSVLLFAMLRMKYRALMCAPTNIAITEVAARVLKLVKEANKTSCVVDDRSFGDILLFGSEERLDNDPEIKEISLDYRVKRLQECFGPLGWQHCFTSMVSFLEDCVPQYNIFLKIESTKEMEHGSEDENQAKVLCSETDCKKRIHNSFLEYARERFETLALPLRRCLKILHTHISKIYYEGHNFEDLENLLGQLDSFETCLFSHGTSSEVVVEHFSHSKDDKLLPQNHCDTSHLCSIRSQCISVLKVLRDSLHELNLPCASNKDSIVQFCFKSASLLFSTALDSSKLYKVEMRPLNVLVIDEASQLKECESAIPLQLPGITHSVLIGDECQLPAMVQSNVSNEAGFGKSLFQRLITLGHSKHILNVQYRMHPSISCFPNACFYNNKILDAAGVKHKSYEKHYLPWPMFGPFSFINVPGREEEDDSGGSCRNMIEVALMLKLVRTLFRAWDSSRSREKLSVGIISPYAAQVDAILEKLGKKYDTADGFAVKVKSVEGFQGSEEDIIIISTVRSNSWGAIGFVSNFQRTNVALTRARHCLWILGDGRTLSKRESVWQLLVHDAKTRHCFFNADEDKDLAKVILDAKKYFNHLDDLLSQDSVLFKNARWKVLSSDNFIKSFGKLKSARTKKSVLSLLLKLSSGWRPKKRNVELICETSKMVLKQFKVEGLYIVCSIDVVKAEGYSYTQVLKAWDLLPLEDIERLVKRLDCFFNNYTNDFIHCCKEKCLVGDLEVPKTWKASFDIVRYETSGQDGRRYLENSKVNESLMLMKFYSLSSGVVSHLLSDDCGRELELPFEVTDHERDIILFPRSTFILGRSGTGKTTLLTLKLCRQEQLYLLATQGFDEFNNTNNSNPVCRPNWNMDDAGRTDAAALRQLFVTVSPKLCYAVKHHVLQLKSFASGEKFSQEGSLQDDDDDIDGASQFKDIPDSLVDILPNAYPLVITLQKFLIMLDGTIGNSFFEKFYDGSELSNLGAGNTPALVRKCVRTREVNFEKFCSIYWPRFNAKLTKKLDSSRVYTEIMSHIKGGLRSGDSCDGKLNENDYVKLSEGRASTLSSHERQMIYDIFQDYERMKGQNGEFDMADVVIDLHYRLQNERYEGDIMDFVYIDEVQDLTMRQISLFRHVCKNVREGFVFCGDTAQTISKGIDFRFEDIRSLFYNEFILKSKCETHNGRKEKGQISKSFHLSQNFRTHDGVLRLAQSVTDLLYRFFPSFVDILCPETCLIYGEAPIWLESDSKENVVSKIFTNKAGGHMVGFGAEQVILVRDDRAKNKILELVGKQALVLTILESKGLEFQDVLLYNFLGSSPLKNDWRIVYEYMKEQGLLELECPFPCFDQAKHNLLCSELKQLYVAITRTRQRLWICEDVEEFPEPILNYWKKKCLIQVRKLDDSLAQEMQYTSTLKEWKSRGYKLLHQGNYEMATTCFERGNDMYGAKLSKALGLRASADRLHGSNPEMATIYRRDAAELFDSIGKAELAVECFCMSKEYERAGQIYLYKCGESALERAAECFVLAGRYKTAAEVYARGKYFSKCLFACTKGQLFDTGLQYLQHWKQIGKKSKDLEELNQKFLESCAHHYHKINNKRKMMNCVRAFDSMNSRRIFLQSLECFDELLVLEEESGNILEAVNIAKMIGDLLRAAHLLGKVAQFEEAAHLILWFVFANSLWIDGSKGWPLKQFKENEELLTKAKSFAKNLSDEFYGLVCSEADILLNKPSNLFLMTEYLSYFQSQNSIRGEIVTARTILDHHLHLNVSKYECIDELVFDLPSYSEEQISNNRVSSETLVYFWNFWKQEILKLVEYLDHAEKQGGTNDSRGYGDFCFNYFGVLRQFNGQNTVHLVLNSDVEWLRILPNKHVCRNQKRVSISIRKFFSTARSYWCSELLTVGRQVLKMLELLYYFTHISITSHGNSFPSFNRSRLLTHIYEVASFLLNSRSLDSKHLENDLMKFVKLSTKHFFGYVFPLDSRESLGENMLSLRGTEIARNLLEEVILEKTRTKNNSLSYGEIDKVALIILGSHQLDTELYGKILECLQWNVAWKNFIASLKEDRSSPTVSMTNKIQGNVELVIFKFLEVLQDTYEADWRNISDYISPVCFLYLVERYLILLSFFDGSIFTSKTTFVEWLMYQDGGPYAPSSFVAVDQQSLEGILKFVIGMIQEFLYSNEETINWIRKSQMNVKKYHSLLVLRLVIILCLLHLNYGMGLDLLSDLLCQQHITELLPREFCDALQRYNCSNSDINVLADAFKKIGNPLVMVSMQESYPRIRCKDAIFVDLNVNPGKEEILRILFPKTGSSQYQTAGDSVEVFPPPSYDEWKSSEVSDQDLNSHQNQNVGDHFNLDYFLDLVEALKVVDDIKDRSTILSYASTLRVFLGNFVHNVEAGMKECLQKKPAGGEDDNSRDANAISSMLDLMKKLHSQLEPSKLKLKSSILIIDALCEELQSWSIMSPFLQPLYYLEKDENHESDEPGDRCGCVEESTSKDDPWLEKDENHESDEPGDRCGCVEESTSKDDPWLEKDENHESDEPGDRCGCVEESTSKVEECNKGKQPDSEATANPESQGNCKSKTTVSVDAESASGLTFLKF